MRFDRIARALRRGWVTAAIFVVLGTAVGAAVTLETPKVYRTSAQIFVATSANPDPAHPQAPNSQVAAAVRGYARLASERTVLSAVKSQLGLRAPVAQLSRHLTVDVPPGTVLINVHVADSGPVQAAQLANTVAEQLDRTVESDTKDPTDTSRIRLQLVASATVPHSPAQPRPALNLGVGAAIGLLLGGGVLVLLAMSDHTIRRPRDLESFGIPLLAAVPSDPEAERHPIAFRDDADSARSAAYRKLAACLDESADDAQLVAIAGGVKRDGGSAVALNLAAELASDGFRVCLLELDVRAPLLAEMLGVGDRNGIVTALDTHVPVTSVAFGLSRNLAVVPVGERPDGVGDPLSVDAARSLLHEARRAVDCVVVDVAPVLGNVDAARICALVDCTVLVHRAGEATRSQVRRSIAALSRGGIRPAGFVLTNAPSTSRRSGRHRTDQPALEADDLLASSAGKVR